ncbi:uncharacterized protein LOC143922546 [Arctopsyche grandis]|uniref:uncharacterized protein LOC143922546 n=1 Tax=Arctopsyche grandis TaxID=121162 RepID=UPI00406DA048
MLRRRRSSEPDVGWWGDGGGRGIDMLDEGTPSWTVSRCGSRRCCGICRPSRREDASGGGRGQMRRMMMLRWCVSLMNVVVLGGLFYVYWIVHDSVSNFQDHHLTRSPIYMQWRLVPIHCGADVDVVAGLASCR